MDVTIINLTMYVSSCNCVLNYTYQLTYSFKFGQQKYFQLKYKLRLTFKDIFC